MGEIKTVYIIEDDALILEGLIHIIEREVDISVCRKTEDGREPFTAISTLKPDLALIDISLTSVDGLSLVKKIKAGVPETSVLALSSYGGFFYAERALKAGADGYLLKDEAVEKIGTAIQKIFNGERYLSENMKSLMVEKYIHRDNSGDSGIDRLSDREAEVFTLMGKGLPTTEIAERLQVSVKTVESHRLHIKKKLGAKSASELAHIAFQWEHMERMG